jgi:hypothetical protein
MNRSPFDGHPYYCKICGIDFAKYTACEENDCELESEITAKSRKKAGVSTTQAKRAADLTPDDVVLLHDNSLRTVKEVNHGDGLIPKGRENDERSVLITWVEGGTSMILRTSECLLVEGKKNG